MILNSNIPFIWLAANLENRAQFLAIYPIAEIKDMDSYSSPYDLYAKVNVTKPTEIWTRLSNLYLGDGNAYSNLKCSYYSSTRLSKIISLSVGHNLLAVEIIGYFTRLLEIDIHAKWKKKPGNRLLISGKYVGQYQ